MDEEKVYRWTLEQKEEESCRIIQEAFERFRSEEMATTFTGGKDSTVVLHLMRTVFDGQVPIPVLNIDTSVKFPEIYAFRDRLATEWGFRLIVARNDEALKTIRIAEDPKECCFQLKASVLNRAIREHGWKAVFTAVRWDEQEARANEVYFSPRTDPEHTRIQPILHFTEEDIWAYIEKYDVPRVSLYDQGYRSLGCMPCTKPSGEGGPERGGRSQDKEEIMAQLRGLGYF